jgi:hypothetical protein
MRAIWILLFPFALAACDATSQSAAFTYADAWNPHGRPRSDAALQVDTRACDAKTRGGQAYGSPKFKACMRAHGWKFDAVEAASSSDADTDSSSAYVAPPDTSSSNDATQAAIDSNNQEAALNASTAAAQQQFNDGIAAAQQQMNNAVFNQP